MSQDILLSIEKLLDRKLSDNAPRNGSPWWSRSIFVMGPIAAIALALVAQQMGWFPSPLREDHEEILNELSVIQSSEETRVDLLTQICIYLAPSDSGKNECVKISRYTQPSVPTIPYIP